MDDPTLPLPGLSPLGRKSIVARFDGGSVSSDAGVLVLREVEQRLGVADRLAECLDDPRNPDLIVHGLGDMIRFRMLMIAAGYEDGNDATSLRQDPVFKMAQGRLPSGCDLASQPTLSRLENLPDPRALLRMGRAMVDLYCASFTKVPKRIVFDIDDTFDAVHGGQQMRLAEVYMAQHNERFAVKAAEEGSAFVPFVGDLDNTLCVQEERVVGHHNTVRYERRVLRIPEQSHRHHFVKAKVRVHEYSDGSLAIFHGPRRLARYTADGTVHKPPRRRDTPVA